MVGSPISRSISTDSALSGRASPSDAQPGPMLSPMSLLLSNAIESIEGHPRKTIELVMMRDRNIALLETLQPAYVFYSDVLGSQTNAKEIIWNCVNIPPEGVNIHRKILQDRFCCSVVHATGTLNHTLYIPVKGLQKLAVAFVFQAPATQVLIATLSLKK